MPGFHHVELWVADIEAASTDWGWLLGRVGFSLESEWPEGRSWSAGGAYLTITTSPTLSDVVHDRRRAGLNHLAFEGGSASEVDVTMSAAAAHGWRPLYAERYPHAGGPDHYAGWLENRDGFKVELVAATTSG